MFQPNTYLIMEVAHQSKVENVDVCEDDIHMGYEPQTELELIEPDKPSLERLVGTLCGKAALHQFKKGDLVAVSLRHRGYTNNGELVNHIIIEDIKLVKDLDYLYL